MLAKIFFLILVASAAAVPIVTTVSLQPFVVNEEIRVQLVGAVFSNGWAVRLARNTSSCDDLTTFTGGLAAGNVPASTISNIVRWTIDDSPSSWVAALRPKYVTENAVVCWSSNGGTTWSTAITRARDKLFRIWKKAPLAVSVPQTITAGAKFRVLVLQPLGLSSRAVLVANESSCSGSTPKAPLTRVTRYRGEGFEFTLPKARPNVFLCVALNFNAQWSIIPFAANSNLQPISSIPVYSSVVRFRKATVDCTPAIAGVQMNCTIDIRNKTLIPISTSSVSIYRLTDGGGVEECPLPILQSVNSTRLSFSFTPQRSGREGTIQLRFVGAPLLINADNATKAYFANVNVTIRNLTSVWANHIIPWYVQDITLKKFAVQPGFATLQSYDTSNLLSLSAFNLSGAWTIQQGVYQFNGKLNGTLNNDSFAITLNSTNKSTVVRSVTVPATSERCRLRLHYFYLSTMLVREVSVQVGSVQVISGNVTKAYQLYNYQHQMIVVGTGLRPSGIVGDAFTLEQLTCEIPYLSSTNVTIVLSIDHTIARQLYYVDPELTCTVSPSAVTNAGDVTALKRLYNSAGVGAGLLNWVSGNVFNGDPCTNQWQGVICRNMRVVALELTDSQLSGSIPSMPELTMLEVVRVSRNALSGSFPLNNSRLTHVDVSHNYLTALNTTNGFAFDNHQCIVTLQAQYNKLMSFPQPTSLPRLIQLDLSINEMFGSIPQLNSSIVPALQVLHLSTNHFVGSLPSSFPLRMYSVDLSHNRLQGTIPSWKLRKIIFLDMSKNLLNGTIPWALAEAELGGSLVLRAEDNFLTGVVPRLSAKLLDLRYNYFECPLMRPEIDTNTSEMERIVAWGVSDWCDYNSGRSGY